MSNFRQGLRILRHNPGFAVTAILALALGIGANTAIFTFVDAMLLRPLPYPQADRLMRLYEKFVGSERGNVSPATWLEWQAQADLFEGFAAWNDTRRILTESGEPEVLFTQTVSYEFFPLLRAQAFRGRVFTADDDRPNADPVVILSHSLWQRRFGGNEAILGKSIRLNEIQHRVIGVMPPGFHFVENDTAIWQPFSLNRSQDWRTQGRFIKVVARLKSGVSLDTARAQMEAISRNLEERFPAYHKTTSAIVVPLRDAIVGQVRTPLLILLASVGALLLIGCFNVANMLLARTAIRQREMAVRIALGAGRWNIVRQLFGENLALAACGGFLGIVLAYWMVDGLLTLIPKELVQITEAPLDLRVLAFTLGISVVSCLLFGLAPAMTASASAPISSMHDGGRAGTQRMTALRRIFIVGQVALTVILLCGAGLLVRSLMKLQSVDAGMDPTDLLTARVALPPEKYRESEQRVRFFEQAVQRIKELPNVIDATAFNSLPVFGAGGGTVVQIQGQPIIPLFEGGRFTLAHSAMPGYFKTIKARLIQGRDFGPDEMRKGTPPAFIVNETFVRKFLKGQNPLDSAISVMMERENPYGRIIGVIADIKQNALDRQAEPAVFYSYGRFTYPGMTLIVRTTDQASVARDLQKIIREIDPNQPVAQIQSMEKVMADSIGRQRLSAIVVACFAISALLLASIGIYGVLSYLIVERTKEIGIRMALGAQAMEVVRLIAAQGTAPALIGLGIGIAAAAMLTRIIGDQLFEVKPGDPATFTAAALLLAFVALSAILIPAWRATRIDPMVALREE